MEGTRTPVRIYAKLNTWPSSVSKRKLEFRKSDTPYLEGQRDFVSGLIMGIVGVTMWVIGVIKPLAKPP